jgi:exonuclease III
VTIRYEFTDPEHLRVRTFLGKLVKTKDPEDTAAVGRRIRTMDAVVLAVQEVENINVLRSFNKELLGGLYRHEVLIEGNDPRFIDVGLLSKLPVGAITSHQTAEHDEAPGMRVFGRDLLQAEILHPTRKERLFTLYNTHLKSHFVPHDQDQIEGARKADARRRRQAETISRIVAAQERTNGRFVLVGDMNDPMDAPTLAAIRTIEGQPLTNALANPTETRAETRETSGPDPQTASWTYRRKESGEAAQHHLYDQIWRSRALASRMSDAFIERRTKHGGDGSDHDPAWVRLSF